MAALQQFFYDGQIERFLAQFIRIISGFQVEYGLDTNGNRALQRVPVYWGDGSRQVASIITNNSSGSVMNTVPAMTVYINNITYDRNRVQDPTFVGKMQVRQRYYNEDTQEFENRQGNAFTIERPMPVPYTIELKVDIWTSNTKQKLQLLEQLIVLFNPEMEIQSTDNYIDWTSLSVVFLDSPNWTSRTVPIGTENPIDVATLTFKLPVWISAPAKVKKLGVIQNIVSNVFNNSGDLSDSILNDTNLMGNKLHVSPMGYNLLLIKNTLTLLKVQDLEYPRDLVGNSDVLTETPTKIGTRDSWVSLVGVYGSLQNGVSQIRIASADGSSEVVGTVSHHPTDDSLLIFNADIDTYPTNTLSPITAIIDPYKVTVGSDILTPAAGTRYLILHAIGSVDNLTDNAAIAWHGADDSDLIANANDIIEYNGTHWNVVFDSLAESSIQYVSNLNTGTQYKWDLNQWVKSFEGEYRHGNWSLIL